MPQTSYKASIENLDISQLIQQGLLLHQQGNLNGARSFYEQVLKIQPRHFDALQLLGTIAGQMKDYQQSLELLTKALTINPSHPITHYNRGQALQELNRFEDALVSYDRAIALKPDYAEAYSNRGSILHELKQFKEALVSLQQAITINPRLSALTYYNLGLTLQELKHFEDAIANYQQAIVIKPDYAQAYSNYGIALHQLGRFEEGIDSYNKAIFLKDDYEDAYYNRAICFEQLKHFEDAIANYQQAIVIKPDYAQAHWNLSLVQLLKGNFKDGWLGYEWRWKNEETNKIAGIRAFSQPLWLGEEPLVGKTILLYAEQGLGDTIQFCRYVPMVSALGAKVILEVPSSLVGLLHDLESVSQIIPYGDKLPEFDYQCPLLSLPLAFKTNLNNIPSYPHYITSNKNKVAQWRQYIGESGFKIAIVWQGSSQNKIDVGRSFSVHLFEGLSKIKGVRLISLQKNVGVEQLQSLPAEMQIEVLPEDFDSSSGAFLDSAAVMKCVDLVITSDTALAHLAGALGVKTWLPLKYVPDWRWLLDRDDSPWYPSIKIYRQATRGDWDSVFERIKNDLLKLLY
jgi:tetratricopeptide (TPR) repeat protein